MTIVLPLRTRRVRRRRDPPAPGDAASPPTDRVPRAARMLALAHHWRGLIRAGVVKDQAALAALVGVTRARITQVMDLLYLAPDIQEEILFQPDGGLGKPCHRDLVRVAAEPLWVEQRRHASDGRPRGSKPPSTAA
jgi:hypothetical protein